MDRDNTQINEVTNYMNLSEDCKIDEYVCPLCNTRVIKIVKVDKDAVDKVS
jgi:uncharacterized protein with PIN domain